MDWSVWVVNLHHKKPFDVYCGRPSRWGNPFVLGKDGDRIEVIKKYKAWVLTQPELCAAMKKELRGKLLGCWCAPHLCHCEVIAAIANS